MKILLVLPAGERVRVTKERSEVPKRAMLRFSVLPLTIVGALTPREHDVRIVDENVEPLDLDDDADVVGITFMTALAPRAYEIARAFRARGKVVVGGGFHPTLYPEDAERQFDAIVMGDAEGAWEEVLRDIAAGRLKKRYMAARGDGSAALATPVPRRDLLAHTSKYYVTINAVQTGRGCRHGCRYCSVTAFHERTHRRRGLAEVLAELGSIPRGFIFVDDNIMACREYARALFRAMIPLRKRWVGQCSIEIADDPELLRLAYEAGCRGLFVGVETTDERNLAALDKEFNESRRYPQRLRRIRRQGIAVVAGMIVGLDGDDTGAFERSLRFLQRTGIDGLQLNILTPLPGTPLFVEMERAGRMADEDWSHYDFRHVVFRPARMTAEQLQQGADWLYAQYYRLDRILVRTARTLWTCGWLPAWLILRLNLTYRYDNRREGIRGRNPAEVRTEAGLPDTASVPAPAGSQSWMGR
jgi:radical SAM superfamily enzyme YgiQ (UPF0313 family)